MTEIEDTVDNDLARIRAQMIQDLALASETADFGLDGQGRTTEVSPLRRTANSQRKAGRETATERTMAANLGLAMDNMAVAPAIYQRAVEKGIGRWLPRYTLLESKLI